MCVCVCVCVRVCACVCVRACVCVCLLRVVFFFSLWCIYYIYTGIAEKARGMLSSLKAVVEGHKGIYSETPL